jgi:hypothetical protein
VRTIFLLHNQGQEKSGLVQLRAFRFAAFTVKNQAGFWLDHGEGKSGNE